MVPPAGAGPGGARADEAIAAPKNADPDPQLFPCKPSVLRGPPEGAMIAVWTPRQSEVVGEGHAPVVAVLLAAAEADDPIHVPKGA
jgi:hypothetical protein